MDYIDVILHIPLYTYLISLEVWWFIGEILPHPSWSEQANLLQNFIYLIPARIVYGILFPEKVVIKRVQGRIGLRRQSKVKPSKSDHHSATAVISDFIKH